MRENIKHYPIKYNMSSTLRQFFTCITESKELQDRLYNTSTLLEVSHIAKEMGFDVSPAEVVQSQAGRVLAIINERTDDVGILLSGGKPKTGAQWGRGGSGYLDRAGYWLITLRAESTAHPESKKIDELFSQLLDNTNLRDKVISAKTIADVVAVLNENSISQDPVELLAYHAAVILELDEELATEVAG
jgi:hypothetical protein